MYIIVHLTEEWGDTPLSYHGDCENILSFLRKLKGTRGIDRRYLTTHVLFKWAARTTAALQYQVFPWDRVSRKPGRPWTCCAEDDLVPLVLLFLSTELIDERSQRCAAGLGTGASYIADKHTCAPCLTSTSAYILSYKEHVCYRHTLGYGGLGCHCEREVKSRVHSGPRFYSREEC